MILLAIHIHNPLEFPQGVCARGIRVPTRPSEGMQPVLVQKGFIA